MNKSIATHFSSPIIDKILYSGIRNKHHLKIRRIGYFRHSLKLILILLFRKRKSEKDVALNQHVVLNFLPDSNFEINKNAWLKNISFINTDNRNLLLIELYLAIAFLINIKSLQRFLFKICAGYVADLDNKYQIDLLLCGHPTFLVTFISFILKKREKEVVTVQHGIYNLNFYKVLWFEKNVASHIIVFGEHFKKMYISQGVNPEKVIVGSPYFGSTFKKDDCIESEITFKEKKVIFLGQQLYKVNSSIFEVYNRTLNLLYKYFKERNIDFYYKPHPRENISKSLSTENASRFKIYKDNHKALLWESFDLYMSANSSLIIETYLQEKQCFQIEMLNSDMPFDNFNNYTGIPLVQAHDISDNSFQGFYKFTYDSNYINITEDPNRRLGEIIINLLAGAH